MLNWAWTRNVLDTDRKTDLFSSIVPLYVLWKQPSKQDVFIPVSSLVKDNGWSFNYRNWQLKFFFSDMILFDIFCTQPIKVVALSINTYMFWMSIWICLMTIINTHTTGGECLLISPIHDKKWSLLPKLHNVRNRYLMRHRSFYKALYQMLGGLPSAKIENGMSYFM